MKEIPSGYGELPDNKESKPAVSVGYLLELATLGAVLLGVCMFFGGY